MDSTRVEDLGESPAAATPASGELQVAGALSDQCTQCSAHLAPDQRYCVECGQRRGEARFPVSDMMSRQAAAAPPPPPKRRMRVSSNATLIAGIGTLLLAMAVGVLIGRTSNDSNGKAAAAQVITVSGGGATGTTGASAAAASAAAAGGGGKKSKNKKSSKGNSASATGGKAPANPVVTVGSPGTGPGYKNGKFTGDFFGN
jgi:hypothetical protein